MPRDRADKFLCARELPFDRPSSLQHSEDAKVFAKEFLFGAEPASHSLREYVELMWVHTEKVCKLDLY